MLSFAAGTTNFVSSNFFSTRFSSRVTSFLHPSGARFRVLASLSREQRPVLPVVSPTRNGVSSVFPSRAISLIRPAEMAESLLIRVATSDVLFTTRV